MTNNKHPSILEDLEDHLFASIEKARRAPFYKKRILKPITDWSDFYKIPFTTKQDLREGYPFSFLAVPIEEVAVYFESSGSSGEPTSSFFTEKDMNDMAARFARNGVELNQKDRVLVKTPYSLLTTGHQAHLGTRIKGGMVVPADNRSSLMPYTRVIRLLHDLEITVSWSLPTEPIIWSEVARKMGFRPEKDFPHLRAFVVAGEILSDTKRRRIEEIWGGVPVFQDYGSTETGSLAGECPYKNLHLWSDRFLFEVYDPITGQTNRKGTGQLIVTTLFREAMPLIRYNMEDVVDISDEVCPCGSPFPKVQILGRRSDEVIIQGKKYMPIDLENLVYSLPIERKVLFWRARYSNNQLLVQIEAPSDQAKFAQTDLEDRIRMHLGIRARVEPVPPGTILSENTLIRKMGFAKPKFLFKDDEDWSNALQYQ